MEEDDQDSNRYDGGKGFFYAANHRTALVLPNRGIVGNKCNVGTYSTRFLRSFNPLCPLWFNPNYFNRKGRKDGAKDAKDLFLEVLMLKTLG